MRFDMRPIDMCFNAVFLNTSSKKNEARAWKHSHAFSLVDAFKHVLNVFQSRSDVLVF